MIYEMSKFWSKIEVIPTHETDFRNSENEEKKMTENNFHYLSI